MSVEHGLVTLLSTIKTTVLAAVPTCSSLWSFLLSRLGFFKMNSFRTLEKKNKGAKVLNKLKLKTVFWKILTETPVTKEKRHFVEAGFYQSKLYLVCLV